MTDYEVGQNVVIYPGTVIGAGAKILDNAVVGKQPSLSPRSTAKREPLPMCKVEVDKCFEHRVGKLGCVNPEFFEVPRGEPTFKVIARGNLGRP